MLCSNKTKLSNSGLICCWCLSVLLLQVSAPSTRAQLSLEGAPDCWQVEVSHLLVASHPKYPPHPGLLLAEVSSPGLTCRWWGLKYVSHHGLLSRVRTSRELDQKQNSQGTWMWDIVSQVETSVPRSSA